MSFELSAGLRMLDDTGREWEVIGPAGDESSDGTPRWELRLTGSSRRGDTRPIGDITSCSTAWAQAHCTPVGPVVVDPPCGDGRQTVAIGAMLRVFDTNREMIAFLDDQLAGSDLRAGWYGWQPDTVDETPDLFACWDTDSDRLVWSEP